MFESKRSRNVRYYRKWPRDLPGFKGGTLCLPGNCNPVGFKLHSPRTVTCSSLGNSPCKWEELENAVLILLHSSQQCVCQSLLMFPTDSGVVDAGVQFYKEELQPKIIFCLLTSFSTKERQIKRFPPRRRGSVENSGWKIAIFSAAVAARAPDIIDSSRLPSQAVSSKRISGSTVALSTLKEAFMVWCVAFGCSNGEKKNTKKRNVSLYWHPVILVSGRGQSVAQWNWLTQRSLTRVTDAEY